MRLTIAVAILATLVFSKASRSDPDVPHWGVPAVAQFLAVGPSGDVYVASAGLVWHYSATGQSINWLVIPSNTIGFSVGPLDSVCCLTRTGDPSPVYRVEKFDSHGIPGSVTRIELEHEFVGSFAVGSGGEFYVSTTYGLACFEPNGATRQCACSGGRDQQEVVSGPNDFMYVLGWADGHETLARCGSSGSSWRYDFPSDPKDPAHTPVDPAIALAIAQDGGVYLAFADRYERWDSDGKRQGVWYDTVSNMIAGDGAGTLYAARGQSIFLYDPSVATATARISLGQLKARYAR